MKILKQLAIVALVCYGQSMFAITSEQRSALQQRIRNLPQDQIDARIAQLQDVRVEQRNNETLLVDPSTGNIIGDERSYLMSLEVLEWLRENEYETFSQIAEYCQDNSHYDYAGYLYDPLPRKWLSAVGGLESLVSGTQTFRWSAAIAHIIRHNIQLTQVIYAKAAGKKR